MVLPKRRFETDNDDFQSTDQDIDSLIAKFLTPIDNIRSYARPGPVFSGTSYEEFNGLEISSQRPLESRVHAFYRYIGFPVATEKGFYNPGFNPTGQFLENISKKKKTVNEQFNQSDFKRIVNEREEIPIDNRSIFNRQDLNASIYAILLSTDIRPFQIMNDSLGPFEVDEQTFSVAPRQQTVEDFFKTNPNISKSEIIELAGLLGANFTESRHVLKPFVVDPRIDVTVMPDKNRVAVPFLPDASSLKLDERNSVLRPGLELIIRERFLSSSEIDKEFLETAKKIAINEVGPNDLLINVGSNTIDTNAILNTIEAVLGESDPSLINELFITNIQVKYINDLVKILKGLIKTLINSIETINIAREEINWVPIPNPEGPEYGSRNAKLSRNLTFNNLTKTDKDIVALKLKKIAAEKKITESENLGNFASPFSITTVSVDISKIEEELSELTQKRDKIASLAFTAMRNIDVIVGESSGLGLIDVISVYIALWAMDSVALFNLLDDEAKKRLNDNIGDVSISFLPDSDENTIVSALQEFEDKLRNVLTFVDREYARQALSPGEEEGGMIFSDN